MFQLEKSHTFSDPERRICAGHASTNRLICSTDGGTFHVFTINDCVLVYTRHDSQDWISTFESFSPGAEAEDEMLVVAQGLSIRLYNLATGLPCREPQMAHDKPILKLKAFQCGTTSSNSVHPTVLASADLNGEIKLWEVDNGRLKLRHILSGHSQSITHLSLYPHDRNLLISGSYDSSIRIWNAKTGKQTMLCELQDDIKRSRSVINRAGDTVSYTETVSSMTVTPDGTLIAGGLGGFVRMWDLHTGKLQKSWQAHNGGHPQVGPVLNKILLHPSGKAFITTGTDGVIRLWDLSTHQLIREIKPFEHSTLPGTIAWHNERLICAGKDGAPENSCGDFNRVIVWDLIEIQLPEVLAESCDQLGAYQTVHAVYAVDSRIVVLASKRGTGVVEIWKDSEMK